MFIRRFIHALIYSVITLMISIQSTPDGQQLIMAYRGLWIPAMIALIMCAYNAAMALHAALEEAS